MSSTQSIKQYLANIDYGWTKPESLVVFVPGLSFYTLNQQLSHLFTTIQDKCKTAYDYHNYLKSKECTKLTTVYKAHALGSLVQAVACIAAVQLTGMTAFWLPAVIAIYDLARCIRGLSYEAVTLDGKKVVITP